MQLLTLQVQKAEMESIGMSARMDSVGNVIGRYVPKGCVEGASAVASGSHLDSVPFGGAFDGSLGVIAALECANVLIETDCDDKLKSPLCHPIEVIGFSEEEGRFGGMLGSQAMVGAVDDAWFRSATDDEGLLLTDALKSAGFDPEKYSEAQRDKTEIEAFLELHIEQGPVLVVTGIAGTINWEITLTGEANHSGTTPMQMRKDAFFGLAQFGAAIPGIIERVGDSASRVTVGHVKLHPNFPHSVPGRAEFSLNCRSDKDDVMWALAEACREELQAAAAAHKLELHINEKSWLAGAPCNQDIITMLHAAAMSVVPDGTDVPLMPSGAGHDTQFISHIAKTGMVFIPSQGGVSHAPEEFTPWSPIEIGTNVLLQGLLALAQRHCASVATTKEDQ